MSVDKPAKWPVCFLSFMPPVSRCIQMILKTMTTGGSTWKESHGSVVNRFRPQIFSLVSIERKLFLWNEMRTMQKKTGQEGEEGEEGGGVGGGRVGKDASQPIFYPVWIKLNGPPFYWSVWKSTLRVCGCVRACVWERERNTERENGRILQRFFIHGVFWKNP